MAPPLLLVAGLLLHLLAAGISAAPLSSDPNPADFIRSSCSTTLYPKLCYTSLIPYAGAIRHSPLILAVTAANVSLSKIKDASTTARAIQRGSTGRVGAALRDCVESLRTAASLTKDSVAEIKKLDPAAAAGGGPGIAWSASNAQTWMSAALTNEDTCVDGFDDIGGAAGTAAQAVCGKVGRVKKYSSNALALLNALVNG
ncbi:hypothetical protein KSP39_PZI020412 [Platanthera zijinensis]|uniref:Pectinesterase inhibitor domain-containing protein n=1 Tax=Platanthera zijinensis TaxID=2320716 RepID=A0AAP0FX50_9ASPA